MNLESMKLLQCNDVHIVFCFLVKKPTALDAECVICMDR